MGRVRIGQGSLLERGRWMGCSNPPSIANDLSWNSSLLCCLYLTAVIPRILMLSACSTTFCLYWRTYTCFLHMYVMTSPFSYLFAFQLRSTAALYWRHPSRKLAPRPHVWGRRPVSMVRVPKACVWTLRTPPKNDLLVYISMTHIHIVNTMYIDWILNLIVLVIFFFFFLALLLLFLLLLFLLPAFPFLFSPF